MKTETMIRVQSWFSLTGAIGLLVWWFFMPVFLPVADSATNFQALILDQDWIWVNMIGLLAALFIALGFPGFYLAKQEAFNRTGFIGALLAATGLILFVCIQYYETLIWPAAARIHPELVQVEGALVSGNTGVAAGLIASGVCLGVGYLLFGISALQTRAFSKAPIWCMILGAPVFGNGIVFPLRTLGLLLFVTGTIWLALIIIISTKAIRS